MAMKSEEISNLLDKILALMIAVVVSFTLYLISGCSDDTLKPDDEIKTGKQVAPPYGCIELRSRGGEC